MSPLSLLVRRNASRADHAGHPFAGRPTRRARLVAAGLTLAVAGTLAGCGSSEDEAPGAGSSTGSPTGEVTPSVSPTPSTSSTPAPAPAKTSSGTTIEITITRDSVKPAGKRLKVEAGEPVVFRITAAAAGELHVHSSPEQEIAFPAGTSEHSIVLEQPGVVDVEEHDLHQVIVQLEVR